jgi:hypothetical protein
MPALISTPEQIWLSVAPVDLRRGIDGLSALVQQTLGQQPCAGSAFVFRNASGKIQALILELAHLRRFRYGVKSEAQSGLQRDLFEETCNENIAPVPPGLIDGGLAAVGLLTWILISK